MTLTLSVCFGLCWQVCRVWRGCSRISDSPPVRRWPQRDERNVADVTDDSVDVGEGEVSDLWNRWLLWTNQTLVYDQFYKPPRMQQENWHVCCSVCLALVWRWPPQGFEPWRTLLSSDVAHVSGCISRLDASLLESQACRLMRSHPACVVLGSRVSDCCTWSLECYPVSINSRCLLS